MPCTWQVASLLRSAPRGAVQVDRRKRKIVLSNRSTPRVAKGATVQTRKTRNFRAAGSEFQCTKLYAKQWLVSSQEMTSAILQEKVNETGKPCAESGEEIMPEDGPSPHYLHAETLVRFLDAVEHFQHQVAASLAFCCYGCQVFLQSMLAEPTQWPSFSGVWAEEQVSSTEYRNRRIWWASA